ncbi:N-formylglutamate amidohydrolase [Hephaestia sp. GCM10023244]|uniref:N-formylglutamate amidohydrolase n=1 Tax=unclassified Hephaestia TaxID=2631281 RepID=UPI0020775256|nr:N-formylglutamate amidohydrolase [Hephaestia sp. MAHUQ-44]MCM8730581.1 N-formylglutamate amidohydrolase [Hephaestia sp. MAHUQ-44]
MENAPPFDRHGPAEPTSPVVLSVPHAGRDYPLQLRAALRVPIGQLAALEDRAVDQVALAARIGETTFVQRRARAWIDLNRAEHERDPRVDEGASITRLPFPSAKLRSGLGLVPRRAARSGDLWCRRFTAEEIVARIRLDHRPYHAALSRALAAARARFGVAVLLDLHSMPPLGTGGDTVRIVLGDRFGKSARARFVARLEGEAAAMGCRYALNSPYAGGHILERHAAPRGGIHAVQIEFCRTLYLDAALDRPGEGLERTAALLRRMIDALADEALAQPGALAAE